MKNQNNQTVAIIFILLGAILSIGSGIAINFIEGITDFFGKKIIILCVPLILGGFLSLLSILYLSKNLEIARNLIYLGGIIGLIVNMLSLLALPFLSFKLVDDSKINTDESKPQFASLKKRSRKWLTLPIILGYITLGIFISLIEDRKNMPLNYYGRDGLKLTQTLWDTDVFFGEFWFNFMIFVLLAGILIIKFPPWKKNIWDMPLKKEIKIVKSSFAILLCLLIAMLASWDYSFSVGNNWYETQFAYQITIWPALFAVMMIFAVLLKKKATKNSKENISGMEKQGETETQRLNYISYILLSLFAMSWVYLSLNTNFHPLAVLNLEFPLHYFVFTMGIPICITFFLLSKFSVGRKGRTVKTISKKITITTPKLPWFVFIIFAFTLPLILQVYGALSDPAIGHTQMFDMTLFFWWILSHWPSYLGTICSVIGFFFESRVIYRTYVFKESTDPEKLIEVEETIESKKDEVSQEKEAKKNLASGDISKLKPISVVISTLLSINFLLVKTLHNKNIKKISKPVLLSFLILITIIPPITCLVAQWDARDDPMLLVNQVGYLPDSEKRVIFQMIDDGKNFGDNGTFQIFDISNDNLVFSGRLNYSYKPYVWSENTNYTKYERRYMVGDFTPFNTTGEYYIIGQVDGEEYKSHDFKISEDVYDEAYELLLRFFYYQRCNYKVEDDTVEGYIGHEACHMDDGYVWNGSNDPSYDNQEDAWVYKDLTGGWHDAGDYNKYNSWFQVEWFSVEALAEAALTNVDNKISDITDKYDSEFPDAFDEALWGLKFLVNSINVEGYCGEENRSRVWRDVSGFRQQSEKEARMSFHGPPEMDWTSPRHVGIDNGRVFASHARALEIAGTILKCARLIEEYNTTYPDYEMPDYVSTDVSYLRELAEDVFEVANASAPAGIETFIGQVIYWSEMTMIDDSNSLYLNQTLFDAFTYKSTWWPYPIMMQTIQSQTNSNHFGWSWYYMLGHILNHYMLTGDEMPPLIKTWVDSNVTAIQNGNYNDNFPEPFKTKHHLLTPDDEYVMFYPVENQQNMIEHAWFQAVLSRYDGSSAQPEYTQYYIDWLFGLNPTGYSLMEAAGDKNLPQYHHRYSNALNPGGRVPGAIPNGITYATSTNEIMNLLGLENNGINNYHLHGDIPWVYDLPANPLHHTGAPSNPNEVWIPHDAGVLRLFTSLFQYRNSL